MIFTSRLVSDTGRQKEDYKQLSELCVQLDLLSALYYFAPFFLTLFCFCAHWLFPLIVHFIKPAQISTWHKWDIFTHCLPWCESWRNVCPLLTFYKYAQMKAARRSMNTCCASDEDNSTSRWLHLIDNYQHPLSPVLMSGSAGSLITAGGQAQREQRKSRYLINSLMSPPAIFWPFSSIYKVWRIKKSQEPYLQWKGHISG